MNIDKLIAGLSEDDLKNVISELVYMLDPFEEIIGIVVSGVKLRSAGISNEISVLCDSIGTLGLTSRVVKCLNAENMFCIGDLVQRTEIELFKMKGIGQGTLNEIEKKITQKHLRFGMRLEDWPPESYEKSE